jgi:outer membrane protein
MMQKNRHRSPVFAFGAALVVGASALAASGSAAADDAAAGKHAGSVLVRAHVLGVFPEDNNSSIEAVGGKVDISNRVAPELDFSYFFTDHIAVQLIATLLRPSVRAKGTAVGDLDVGSVNVLPPTLTVQYHFFPQQKFSPYIGGGATAFILFNSKPARGDGIVNDFNTDSHLGGALQAGFDYNISGRWFVNVEVDQIFVKTNATVDTVLGTVRAKTSVDPFLAGIGVGYRF